MIVALVILVFFGSMFILSLVRYNRVKNFAVDYYLDKIMYKIKGKIINEKEILQEVKTLTGIRKKNTYCLRIKRRGFYLLYPNLINIYIITYKDNYKLIVKEPNNYLIYFLPTIVILFAWVLGMMIFALKILALIHNEWEIKFNDVTVIAIMITWSVLLFTQMKLFCLRKLFNMKCKQIISIIQDDIGHILKITVI